MCAEGKLHGGGGVRLIKELKFLKVCLAKTTVVFKQKS